MSSSTPSLPAADFAAGALDATSQADLAARRTAFRALHEQGCFVIPNPWDVGSARYLQHLGFPALATTSAGFAFSQGLPDSGNDAVLALAAWTGFIRAARTLKSEGSFAGFAGLVPYPELNGLFAADLPGHQAPRR